MAVDDHVRSLEEALADLLAKYEENPSPELGRMIRQLELEIVERKGIRGGRETRALRRAADTGHARVPCP
jgi:hypothetical protein